MIPFTACYVVGISLVVLWQNPRRVSYQAFFGFGVTIAIWFAMVQMAGRSLADFWRGLPTDPAFWLRANTIVAAISLWFVALTFESIRNSEDRLLPALKRTLPWIGVTITMSWLCLTDKYFRGMLPGRGIAYYAYSAIGFASLSVLIVQIGRSIPTLPSGRRIEAQFMALVPAVACLAGFTANAAANYLHIGAIKRLNEAAARRWGAGARGEADGTG